jgi:flagellar biosynthetic protein FlhB
MAGQDQTAEKTEEGSEKKVRDAIEQGNVPYSREASVFCSLSAMLAIISLTLANNMKALTGSLAQLFANPAKTIFATPADTITIFGYAATAAATFLMPVMVILIISGLVASFAQGVPRVALERITPKWSKLSPMSGLKRLISTDGLVEFLKSFLKFLIVSVVISLVLRADIVAVIETLYIEPSAIGGLTLKMLARLIAGSLVAFGVLTAGDIVWSQFRWRRDLRMTKQEVKDEHKQSEGDPFFKAKRRSLALDRSRRRMIASVPRATLVIANPTHYAIALRYVREEGGAPVVIAKGQDLIALKIREIAELNNIPVIEDKALARSMYDHVEVSQLIPAEFYKAVAELIHFLQSRGSRASRASLKA